MTRRFQATREQDKILEKREIEIEREWKLYAIENNKRVEKKDAEYQRNLNKVERELEVMRSQMVNKGYRLWNDLPWIKNKQI